MSTQTYIGKDYLSKLLILLLVFVGTGLVLAFSISYSYSILQGRDINNVNSDIGIFSLFIKQILATVIGLIAMLYLLKTPTKTLRNMSSLFVLIFGLAMIYTALFAPEINGSKRWIVIAGVSLQTGDFSRIAVILYLSDLLAQYHKYQMQQTDIEMQRGIVRKLLLRFLITIFIYVGTLYLQSDFSSLLISMLVILSLILVSGVPKSWKFIMLFTSIGFLLIIVLSNPNRLLRIISYFDPGTDPLGVEFQLLKSYKIIGNGGLLGSGIGSNMLDILSLPYFNNDFVFSIIVGEYGLLGALVVLMLFWTMCWYAYKLGRSIYMIDRYYYYLLLAGTVNIVVAAIAHVAVTLGLIPTAGLNLPFYSSGGSSMITSIISYGLILRSAVAVYYYEKNEYAIVNSTSEKISTNILQDAPIS